MKQSLNRLQTPIVVIVLAFVLLFSFTRVFGPIPFAINSVQTTKSNTFQVSGTGKVSAAPDSANVSFGVTKNAATIADAQNQTNTSVTTITNALKSDGVEDKDIKTTSYTVNPNYDFNGSSQRITGYTVTQTIDLTIPQLEKVNNILDTLTTNGANIVNQVSFTFSDTKKKELENQARQLAVTEAKEKAEGLANAAGIHLGRIIDLSEVNTETPRPIMPMALANDAAGSAGVPTQVTPGENSISLTVTLSYETY